jgi:hypothetical protein
MMPSAVTPNLFCSATVLSKSLVFAAVAFTFALGAGAAGLGALTTLAAALVAAIACGSIGFALTGPAAGTAGLIFGAANGFRASSGLPVNAAGCAAFGLGAAGAGFGCAAAIFFAL